METLEVFDRSIQWAANGDFTDTDVDEAKIAVFQQVDCSGKEKKIIL
jgi:Zn-dependent M16 (insulinase) family peptidase